MISAFYVVINPTDFSANIPIPYTAAYLT